MKLSINSHVLAPSLGLAASIGLMFIPSKAINLTGLFTGAVAGGYLASQAAMTSELKNRREDFAATQKRLATREQELATRNLAERKSLEAQLKQAIADRDTAVAQANKQLQQIQAEHKRLIDDAKHVMGDELTRKFEREYNERFDNATADMRRREDEFYHAEGELCDQIEALQVVLAQNESYLREEFGKETGAKVQQWAGRYKQLQGQIAEYGQFIEEAGSEASAELHQKDLAIAKLRGQVELLSAPRKFRGSSQDDTTSNKVIEFFIEKNVPMAVNDFDRKMDKLIVKFFPEGATTTAHVMPLMEELQLRLGLYALPVVAVENNLITITCQTDAKSASKVEIKETPLSRLETAINDSIHLRVVAQSGSGKTVLLGNLINYLTQQVSSDYTLSDPKVTKPENWGNLKPDYYSRECLEHFFGLTETCLIRIDEAAESVKAGNGLPNFEMQFHIIDELEFLYGLSEVSKNKEHNSKLFKINGKSMLKVGREHKMKLLFVTQSPLPSDLNLRRNDFENCSAIFLGSQISAGLNSTDADGLLKDVPPEKIALLKAEYRARMKRGDQYVYLFFNPSQPENPFLGKCPSPGHYAELVTQQHPQNEKLNTFVLRGMDPVTLAASNQGATQSQQGVQVGDSEGAKKSEGANGTASAPQKAPASTSLKSLLSQGTHCPDCGHHSKSYSKRVPNSKGNVSVKCKNTECDRKTFSWKVV